MSEGNFRVVRSASLRWAYPPGTPKDRTHTNQPVLQYLEIDLHSGAARWVPVPTVIEDAANGT